MTDTLDELAATLRAWSARQEVSPSQRRIAAHVLDMVEAVRRSAVRERSDLEHLRTACCYLCRDWAAASCRGEPACPFRLAALLERDRP